MHVLILPSWYPKNADDIGGSFFREQAIALEKAGCKVGVLSVTLRSLRYPIKAIRGDFSTQKESDSGVITYRKHTVNWFPRLPRLQQFFYRRHMMVLFHRYVKEHGRPDIIHVHSMLNAGLAAKKIKNLYGIPYVVTEHSTGYARGIINAEQKKTATLIADQASANFAVSLPFSKLLHNELKLPNTKWDVMPNIVSSNFTKKNREIKLKNKKEFIFFNVCFLTFKKRVDLLLEAFAKAFKNEPNVKLRIGGNGEERLNLEAQAKRLGIEDQVNFLGMLSRSRVSEEMENMDAFVLGSRYETFGVVVIEALAKGKPVIATRCGGPEDIIREQDGLLVPTDDVDTMAAAMQKLYSTSNQYNTDEIRNSCQQRYGELAIARRLITHYQAIVKPDINEEASLEDRNS